MTMFVFSRRAIQTKLELLETVLPSEQHARLIERLNRPGRERLAAMWEVIFLQALSEVVPVRHEMALSSGRQPDFEFELEHGGGRLSIVGDVACVSDAGLDKQNPFNELGREVTRLARKHKLDPNHFRYDVAGERIGDWPKQRMRLLLPKGEAFTRLVKDVIEPFVRELASSLPATADFAHDVPGVRFSIRYDQSQWASGGGHPSYDVAMSLTENPIHRALKAKADQLRAAPADAIRLVILCDGDCAAMTKPGIGGTAGSYTATQIATEFLRKTSAVDLVLLAGVEKRNQFQPLLRDYVMSYDLVAAPANARSIRVNDENIQAITRLLERTIQTIPKPMADACNAALRCQQHGYGLGKHGGYRMSGDKIAISARLEQELLAGDVTPERFAEFHGWGTGPDDRPNPFEQALRRGELVSTINVIDCGDEDDNQFEFHFGPTDPAVSPFRRTVPHPHPGDILQREFLEPLDISQHQLANAIDVPQTRIGEIVGARRSITADTALRLAKFFGMSEHFWMNLQAGYDAAQARDELEDVLARIEPYERAA